jgi:hypothetical protein
VIGGHEVQIEVVAEEGPALGQTKMVTTGGFRVRIGEEANRQAFEEHLLKTILQ